MLSVGSLYHFPRSTDDPVEAETHGWERNFVYRTSGLVILAAMMAMGDYMVVIPPTWKQWLNDYNFLFWMEWIAVWSFAAAWLTKGRVILSEIAIELFSIPKEAIADRLGKAIARRNDCD